MSSIIEIKGLSKSYILNHEGRESYTALRDVMAKKAKKIFSFPAALRAAKVKSSKEEFWALNDVSFDVHQGDRVGIIGRNGAGKSTLLKILSRIIEPTRGSVKINGRIASLLEVGTGFHPELSGRENIFLNGAILGMSQAEIRKHFDEIVAFAEVEKFLDTPVKRYSSGMYVRLAFAVAAHLEPEILIVDEVLAVGDAEFQKKCLGKMEDVSKIGGRTVLFVSHQMPTILNLCESCILLDKGTVSRIGKTESVIAEYLKQEDVSGSVYYAQQDDKIAKKAWPYFRLDKFSIIRDNGKDASIIQASDNNKLQIVVEGEVGEPDSRFNIGFQLKNEYGDNLMISFTTDQPESQWPVLKKGKISFTATIDCSSLNEGKYFIYLVASLHCIKMLYVSDDDIAVAFEVVGNRGNSPYWINRRNSILAPFVKWNSYN